MCSLFRSAAEKYSMFGISCCCSDLKAAHSETRDQHVISELTQFPVVQRLFASPELELKRSKNYSIVIKADERISQ